MRRNQLRDCLTVGKPTVGTHILSVWPTLVELIGHSKQYDYVEFTAEYAPFDMHDLDNLGRAFEVASLGGMIKIEQTQYTHQAMRAIGSGFQSVLFADIRNVEDAKAAVDAAQEAFEGWAGRKPRERGEILRKAYEVIMAQSERIANLITLENGKALSDSRGEIGRAHV